MKQEFEMTQQNMDDIIAINKNMPPVMKFGDSWSGMDLAERINAYWEVLGNEMGFKHMTVEGSSRGKLFFLAEPKPIVIPPSAEEIEMNKYDTLGKIVHQLEGCNYECSGGNLSNNIAFKSLKRMANP